MNGLIFTAPAISGSQFTWQRQRIALLTVQGLGFGIVAGAAFGAIVGVVLVAVCVLPWVLYFKLSMRAKVIADDRGVRVVNRWGSCVFPWASIARFELGRTWHDSTDAGYAVFRSGGRIRLDALIVFTNGTGAVVEGRRSRVTAAVVQLQRALDQRYPHRPAIEERASTAQSSSEWPDESGLTRWRSARDQRRRAAEFH